jgi:hypothetical protein
MTNAYSDDLTVAILYTLFPLHNIPIITLKLGHKRKYPCKIMEIFPGKNRYWWTNVQNCWLKLDNPILYYLCGHTYLFTNPQPHQGDGSEIMMFKAKFLYSRGNMISNYRRYRVLKVHGKNCQYSVRVGGCIVE